jgi:hypothetical protein
VCELCIVQWCAACTLSPEGWRYHLAAAAVAADPAVLSLQPLDVVAMRQTERCVGLGGQQQLPGPCCILHISS